MIPTPSPIPPTDPLVELDLAAARRSRADRIECVLYCYWLTVTYAAHVTPLGYLTDEGERFFKGQLAALL